MKVSERIQFIIDEKHLNQKQFAESIFSTGGYVSQLLKNDSGISNSKALLIEKVHGYAKKWVLTGKGPKRVPLSAEIGLTALQKQIIADIELMSDAELSIIAAYIEALKKKQETAAK
jgi:transcriptional regulator with XRE-family HTH domain